MRILAADLGGTHSRFMLFRKESGMLVPGAVQDLPSSERDFSALLQRVAEQLPGGTGMRGEIDVVAIAAAGAVNDGRVRMTNAPYVVDADEAAAFFPNARVLLMNDFEAQAWACATDSGHTLELLHGDADSVLKAVRTGEEKRPVAVLGAGTGLGAAWLVRSSCGTLFTLPSEAGHSPFPFMAVMSWHLPHFWRIVWTVLPSRQSKSSQAGD